MATIYDIVQGLHQAAANAYDGALGEDQELLATGALRREEGDALIDQRVMDGFNIQISGNLMCLSYMSEIKLKEVYASGFESEIDQRLTDIIGFIKKEYRKITGESVALTEHDDIDVYVQNSSRVRSWVQAKKHYRIGGLNEDMQVAAEADTKPEDSLRKFIDQGGWTGDGGKRPQNDTRPKPSND